MDTPSTLGLIAQRLYALNESLDIPVIVSITLEHGEPVIHANGPRGQQSFKTPEQAAKWIAGMGADPETLTLEYGHGDLRIQVSTALSPHDVMEFTDPAALLGWLDVAGKDPQALADGTKHQRLQALKERQARDAAERIELEKDIQAVPKEAKQDGRV